MDGRRGKEWFGTGGEERLGPASLGWQARRGGRGEAGCGEGGWVWLAGMEGMGMDWRGFVWQVLVGRRGVVRMAGPGAVREVGFGWQAWPGVAWMERQGSGGGFGWQAWRGVVWMAGPGAGGGFGWQARRDGRGWRGRDWRVLVGRRGRVRTGLAWYGWQALRGWRGRAWLGLDWQGFSV